MSHEELSTQKNKTKAADERNKAHISWFDFGQENTNKKVSISLLF